MTLEGTALVAPRDDSTEPWTGIGLADAVADLMAGVESGSWVDGSIGAVGTGVEGLSLAMDPLATLASWGLSWLIEHVRPLSDALEQLTGDADQIRAFAATWRNVAVEIQRVAEELAAVVARDVASWLGRAADASRAHAAAAVDALAAASSTAHAVARIVEGAGALVATVRELVRDLIAECIATLAVRAPRWAVMEAASLGAATPYIVAQASALVARWAAKIARLLTALQASLAQLEPVLGGLDDVIADLRRMFGRLGSRPTPDGRPPTDPGDPSAPPPVTSPADVSPPAQRPPTPTEPAAPGPTPPPSTGGSGLSGVPSYPVIGRHRLTREEVDRLLGDRRQHVLHRHRPGAKKKGKTEFPAGWSDDDIMDAIASIATDPAAARGVGKYDSGYAIGSYDGVVIRVHFFPPGHARAGHISSAYPVPIGDSGDMPSP